MKVLKLNGTVSCIGLEHGKQAKQEIDASLDSYEKLFWYQADINWQQAIELAKSHMNYIEKTNIALLEEMEGVAKGASVHFHDILALNTRSEIALTSNKSDGCTSLAVTPTLADKTYLGQNWDWRASQTKSLIIMDIQQKNKPAIKMITEGGIIGKIGLNSSGLGVCLNAIRADVRSNKLPIHLGLREILNATTLKEAEEKVVDKKIASSANFLMAQEDKTGSHVINVETSPVGEEKTETETAYLSHTNHFCSNTLVDTIGRGKLPTTENTYIRKGRIDELLKDALSKNKTINTVMVKKWLADHEDYPDSICRHKEEGSSDYTNTVTAFSVIMNLTDRKMYFMKGQPCHPEDELFFQF